MNSVNGSNGEIVRYASAASSPSLEEISRMPQGSERTAALKVWKQSRSAEDVAEETNRYFREHAAGEYSVRPIEGKIALSTMVFSHEAAQESRSQLGGVPVAVVDLKTVSHSDPAVERAFAREFYNDSIYQRTAGLIKPFFSKWLKDGRLEPSSIGKHGLYEDFATLCSQLSDCTIIEQIAEKNRGLPVNKWRMTPRLCHLNIRHREVDGLVKAYFDRLCQGGELVDCALRLYNSFWGSYDRTMATATNQVAVKLAEQIYEGAVDTNFKSVTNRWLKEQALLSAGLQAPRAELAREAEMVYGVMCDIVKLTEKGFDLSRRLINVANILSKTVADLTPEERTYSIPYAESLVAAERQAAALELEERRAKLTKVGKGAKMKAVAEPPSIPLQRAKSVDSTEPTSPKPHIPDPREQSRLEIIHALESLKGKKKGAQNLSLHPRVSRWLGSAKDLAAIRKEASYGALEDQEWGQAIIDHHFPRLHRFVANRKLAERYSFSTKYFPPKEGNASVEPIPVIGILATQYISQAGEAAAPEVRSGVVYVAVDQRTKQIYHAHFKPDAENSLVPEKLENIGEHEAEKDGFAVVGQISISLRDDDDLSLEMSGVFPGNQRASYIFHRVFD